MTRRKASRRVGRGTLAIVASLLAGSGLIRLGDGTGLAVARQIEALAQSEQTGTSVEACPVRPDTTALLKAFQAREARIAEAEHKIEERSQALKLAGEEITRQLAALEEQEDMLKATLALAEEGAESDLARLTSVYESMKPKDAATLFEAMAPDFAAGFLGRMRPDAAAAVMTGLSPDFAYSISVILAGRNAQAPVE